MRVILAGINLCQEQSQQLTFTKGSLRRVQNTLGLSNRCFSLTQEHFTGLGSRFKCHFNYVCHLKQKLRLIVQPLRLTRGSTN